MSTTAAILKPWLNSAGEIKSERELREISKTWDQAIWNEYLRNYEGSQSELLFSEKAVRLKRENIVETAFGLTSNYQLKSEHRRLVRRVLKSLTKLQRKILRKYIFDDFHQTEIASKLRISEPAVFYHKEAALKRLSEHPELLNFLHLMKEEKDRASLRPSKKKSQILEVYNAELNRQF